MRARMGGDWFFPSRLASQLVAAHPQRERWERAGVTAVAILVLTAIVIACIALLTDVDLTLADSAFDANAKVFPLRHAWVTEVFNHVILKRIFTTFALLFLIAVLWDLASPRQWTWLRRFQMRVVALSAVLVPTVISLLKQSSDSHCPWDLERYGGTEPYVKLFEYLPAGVEPGHCMPGGHASSALWMISLAVFFVPHRLTLAMAALAAFLSVGLAVGWLQQLRGAHFLTHTLWSAWIALLTVFLITACLDRWPKRRGTTTESLPLT